MCEMIKNVITKVGLAMLVLMALVSSCSGDDYLSAIPAKSTALISIDLQRMAESDGNSDANREEFLKSLLHVDDLASCGLDVSEKMYLFETVDGNLGLCAKVADDDDVNTWLTQLSKQHICSAVTERKGFHFAVLKDSWLVGFSSKAFLVMGPVVADAQAELQRQMVKYLSADEDAGIKSSRLYEQMDSLTTPMAMVAQAQALPDKFVAPFTLGAPKGADASQIVIAANMSVKNGILHIEGKTFSFNDAINKALQQSVKVYRPIQNTYVKSMPADALVGIFMNVDGTKFLPLLQGNQSLQTLLMGINSAIDMDNIIRSVNGDMSIVMPTLGTDNMKMTMAAKLAHAKWLEDVDYWKQSCPQGSTIGNWGKNSFCYSDGKSTFYFGVTDDKQFFSGSDELSAQYSILPSNHPISKAVQQLVVGQKMAMVINLAKSTGGNDAISAATSLISPLFGKLNTIVYTLEN